MMDPRTGFWTFALVNMAAAFLTAVAGVMAIRRGDKARHRRLMLASAGLVGLFIVAYAGKLLVLGKEDLSIWSSGQVIVLRVHEGFVLLFLVAGTAAYALTRRFSGDSPEVTRLARDRHQIAGRTAMIGFSLALITAALVYRAILGTAQ